MTHEPCGALPFEVHDLMVVHCVPHRAWTLHLAHTRQLSGDEAEEVLPSVQLELGPFDEADLIDHLAALQQRQRAWLHLLTTGERS